MQVTHIRNLRKALIGLIVVVLAAVALNYAYQWKLRAGAGAPRVEILGAEMLRTAENIEYAEHQKGVIRFKIRAQKLIETRQGKSYLAGIEAFDFDDSGTVRNHIRSQRAEYEREAKRALFSGDVRIEMGSGVRLETDSLNYDLKANVGTTAELLKMTSDQASGTARGVRYQHAERIVELQSEVDFNLIRTLPQDGGGTRTENVHATSQHAYYGDSDGTLRFEGDARLKSEKSLLSGDRIEAVLAKDRKTIVDLHCRGNAVYEASEESNTRMLRGGEIRFWIHQPSGGLERIEVHGSASYSSRSADGEQELRGEWIRAELDPGGGFLKGILSENRVEFRTRGTSAETTLSGQRLEAFFFPGAAGMPERVKVNGNARMTTMESAGRRKDDLVAEEIQISFKAVEKRSLAEGLQAVGSVRWKSVAESSKPGSAAEEQSLSSQSLSLKYSPDGQFLESGAASGNVDLTGVPARAEQRTEVRRLLAETVRFGFHPGANQVKDFEGSGNVRVFYVRPPDPSLERARQEIETSSKHIRAGFRQQDGTIETVSQWGDFSYQDGDRKATAGRSDYTASTGMMILQDSPRMFDSNGVTTGERIEYNQEKKILTVLRRVETILRPRKDGQKGPFAPSSESGSSSVITAERMDYWTEQSRAQYSGKVQMLSEGGQLQAGEVDIFDAGERVDASGQIRHLIFRSPKGDQDGSGQTSGKPAKARQALIQARRLSYLGGNNSILYREDVTLKSDDVWMSANALDALMDSEGKEVERAAARGAVRVRQADREAKGDMADYYMAQGKFVVTGNLAEIQDPAKGKSRARRLTWFQSDERLLLETK